MKLFWGGGGCVQRLDNSNLSWKEFLEHIQKNLFKKPEEEEKEGLLLIRNLLSNGNKT
jgi:hypothetical protein